MSASDYNTPPALLDLIRQLDRRRQIGLDPCSNATSMVKAKLAWTVEDDGLSHARSWRGHGLVFMNPPHSTSPHNIEPWMQKAYEEFILCPIERENNPTLDAFCGLVPAKTDTEWFHSHAVPFAAKCFIKGRPRFWQGGKETPGPGKFASMLIYQGPCVGAFCSIFGKLGYIV